MPNKINLVGQKYGRLLVIKENTQLITNNTRKNVYWLCSCECNGNIKSYSSTHLRSGNTKSCGCLNSEKSSLNAKKAIKAKTIYEPKIASARRKWKNESYRNKPFILFEDFLNITQQNCTYCGIAPFAKYNYFIKAKNSSKYAIENGYFIFNGIDRIDSLKFYTIDNIVPACNICNMYKNNLTVENFLERIKNLRVNDHKSFIIKTLSLPINNYTKTSVKYTLRHYLDGGLSYEQLYYISQQPCHYCNDTFTNSINYAKNCLKSSLKAKQSGNFNYNGIDRIDSSLPHIIGNVVPCCKYCNFGKSDLNIYDFYNWIMRIKNFQKIKAT